MNSQILEVLLVSSTVSSLCARIVLVCERQDACRGSLGNQNREEMENT